MNSNKFFSFNRFYLLLRNDVLLNYKKYLLTIAAAFILGFIVLFKNMPNYVHNGLDWYIFDANKYTSAFAMCLLGLLAFVGSAFSEFSTKVKTSNYLLLPASTFEKFLSQFVIYVLAGTAIFLIVFLVDAHLARYVALSNLKGFYGEDLGAEKEKYIEVFNYSMLLIKNKYPVISNWNLFDGLAILFGMFSVGMYFFSVKIFFKKLGLIKTAISLIAVVFLGVVVMMLLSQVFFPETKAFDISNEIGYKLKNGLYNIELWMYLSAYCVSLFIIPFGYFKLKEKQL
jgi:hypothetical protein